MSQKLCEACFKKWDLSAILPEDETQNYPYLHCHHDAEKKGCEAGDDPKEVVELKMKAGWKFCANCGRKL